MFNRITLTILRFREKTMDQIKGNWHPLKGNRVNIIKNSWTVWKIKIWMPECQPILHPVLNPPNVTIFVTVRKLNTF